MHKGLIVTQARMTSTRLPGKVLQDLGGRPLLGWHLERLRAAGLPIVVATTLNSSDDPLVDFCKRENIPVVRGSENDVLSRYYDALKQHPSQHIIRVTSDCPLVDGKLIGQAWQDYLANFSQGRCYYSNALKRTFPRGMDFEIFSAGLLQEAYQKAQLPEEREHVTAFFYRDHKAKNIQIEHFLQEQNDADLRLTVDEPLDLEMIRKLVSKYQVRIETSYAEIIQDLRKDPELAKMNSQIEQKKVGEIIFRPAKIEDARFFFDIRNEPVTRSYSLQKGEISWEQHLSWFSQSLISSERKMYVVEFQSDAIGMMRVDRLKDATCSELSWALDSRFRGQGLGARMLQAFVQIHPEKYRARILSSNEVSIKMALKAGFKKQTDQDNEVLVFAN